MYLFGYIRYIRPHIDYGETVLVGAGAVFYFVLVAFESFGAFVRIPSICSNKSSFIGARIGSSMKSIPSRRACLDAGTKSLSPAIKIILSTCFLNANEEMSTPIRISDT